MDLRRPADHRGMSSGSALLVVAWVLVSPFAVAAVVGSSQVARGLVGALHPGPSVVGWVGALLLAAGSLSLASSTAMLVGAPLAGLTIWSRSGGSDDGGGEGPGPEPDDDPDGPGVDWDEFEHAFRSYARDTRRPLSRV
jgi:hypothetical protein